MRKLFFYRQNAFNLKSISYMTYVIFIKAFLSHYTMEPKLIILAEQKITVIKLDRMYNMLLLYVNMFVQVL